MATAAGEDGTMVAVTLPLCFCIHTLVTLISAQNTGKHNTELLANTELLENTELLAKRSSIQKHE